MMRNHTKPGLYSIYWRRMPNSFMVLGGVYVCECVSERVSGTRRLHTQWFGFLMY